MVVVVGLEQDRAKADVGGIRLQMERLREIGVCQEVRGLERSLELQKAWSVNNNPSFALLFFCRKVNYLKAFPSYVSEKLCIFCCIISMERVYVHELHM
mgnify:CR=1 FL=1